MRSGSGISAILSSTASSPFALPFASRARSFIAARSSAVNALADFGLVLGALMESSSWGRGFEPAAVAHQLAAGQLVGLAPGLDPARGDAKPAVPPVLGTRVEAAARGEPVSRLLRQCVDLDDLDVALDHRHVAGVAQAEPSGSGRRQVPAG